MSDMTEKVVVGAIAGAYGVRGEIRIKSFCGTPSDIENYSPLTDEAGNTYDLALIGPIKNGFSARIAHIATKEEADALKGTTLFARRDQLPHLPDDEFYHADLIGLDVVDTGGQLIGHVKAVHNTGSSDLLDVQRVNSSETAMVPFTKEVVPTVDLDIGRIVIDPPNGML